MPFASARGDRPIKALRATSTRSTICGRSPSPSPAPPAATAAAPNANGGPKPAPKRPGFAAWLRHPPRGPKACACVEITANGVHISCAASCTMAFAGDACRGCALAAGPAPEQSASTPGKASAWTKEKNHRRRDGSDNRPSASAAASRAKWRATAAAGLRKRDSQGAIYCFVRKGSTSSSGITGSNTVKYPAG